MPTLYGHARSRANRVLWMLRELGVAFDHVQTDFQAGEARAPDFLAINPNGRVPVLVDDGQVFWESLSINLYLAKKHGGPLAPIDLAEDALATQWSLWAANELEKPLLLACANLALFAPDDRRPDELRVALRRLDRPWNVLDAHLTKQSHLLGARFTVADLNVAGVMALGLSCGVPLDDYPAMQAWLAACLARPAAAWTPATFSLRRPSADTPITALFL